MLFKKIKNIKYLNILPPILVALLLLALVLLVINSMHIASEINKNNFEYIIRVRAIIEEIDNIVENSTENINILSDVISDSYDVNKRKDKIYNIEYLKKIAVLSKSVLTNSLGVDGSWFLFNADLPFAYKIYNWYGVQDGKIVDIRDELEKEHLNDRQLSPNEDPYYFQAILAKKTVWSDIYTDADTKNQMMTIAKPIYKNGILIGVVGVDVSIKNFKQALMNLQTSFEHSEIFLLNDKNKIIYEQLADNNTNPKNNADFIKLFDKKNQSKEAMVEYLDNGIKKIAIRLALYHNYNLVITFPNTVIFEVFEHLFRIIYFIFVIIIVLVIVSLLNRCKIIKMHKKLENEVATIRNIINYSPTIMCVKDNSGVYINCNDKFAEITGFSKDEIIGKTDYDLFEKEFADKLVIKNMEVKQAKDFVVDADWHICANGEKKLLEKYRMPLFDETGASSGILINAFDVTKKYEEQELLKHAKEAAEKATMMKSHFLANMSHEIRTPLNGVLGFLKLLENEKLTGEQKEFISNAQKSSELLLLIINEILDFSKIEAGKLNIENISFDIRSVVDDVLIINMSNASKKGLNLNCLINSDVPQRVFGDPVRIKQVLNNLTSNAIKFTKEGEVIIFVNKLSENEDAVVLSFGVKDTGIGIPEDKLKLIFDSFTQADDSTTRKYGGTGLGLSISEKLSGLMNGSLTVESKINEGSTFVLTLPFKIDTAVFTKNNIPVKVSNDTIKENKFNEKFKILIVEDTELNSLFILAFLNKVGLSCDVEYEGKSAIEAFKSKKYDLILMDCQMPIFDGFETTKEIRKIEGHSIHTPIIAMTANAKKTYKQKCYDAGMDDYICKPIDTDKLLSIISKYLKLETENDISNFSDETSSLHDGSYVDGIIENLVSKVGFTRINAIKLFDKFLDFLYQSLVDIEIAIEKDEFENIKQIAHKLKGASSNLRVEKIAQLSSELIEASSKGDKAVCVNLAIQTKNQLNYLKAVKATE